MACDGPTYEAYNQSLHHCVGSEFLTSCDGHFTCFYALVNLPPSSPELQAESKAEWFACRIVDGKVVITNPGPLEQRGVNAGDVVDFGCAVTENGLGKHLSKFTPEKPARSVSVVFRADRLIVTLAWK